MAVKMAVFVSNDAGCIISHENLIKDIYRKTLSFDVIKSYFFNPSLFDIKIPFVKNKSHKNNSVSLKDVEIVRKAYSLLCTISNEAKRNYQEETNQKAKSLADEFYSQLTRHPESNFRGGNNSEQSLVTNIEGELYLIPEKSLFYCYDVRELKKHLGDNKYDLILMDPPWWNKFIRRKRKKNFKFGYEMVYDKDLSNIPVDDILNENGIVGIWCTSAPSHIRATLTELFPSWNLQYIAQWFWLKVTKEGKPICDFSQNLGKQPFERIIFGARKNTNRILPNPDENKVVISVPSAIHSHKPPLSELLKPYLPENPKCLELFARYLLPNWTSYGFEVLKLQHMSLYIEDVHG